MITSLSRRIQSFYDVDWLSFLAKTVDPRQDWDTRNYYATAFHHVLPCCLSQGLRVFQAKMKASVVRPLLSSSCDSDDEDPTSEAQVWAPVWAARVNAVVDSIDGVTNDVENEHSQDRHMLADPGVIQRSRSTLHVVVHRNRSARHVRRLGIWIREHMQVMAARLAAQIDGNESVRMTPPVHRQRKGRKVEVVLSLVNKCCTSKYAARNTLMFQPLGRLRKRSGQRCPKMNELHMRI